jgi:hypothetical protein
MVREFNKTKKKSFMFNNKMSSPKLVKYVDKNGKIKYKVASISQEKNKYIIQTNVVNGVEKSVLVKLPMDTKSVENPIQKSMNELIYPDHRLTSEKLVDEFIEPSSSQVPSSECKVRDYILSSKTTSKSNIDTEPVIKKKSLNDNNAPIISSVSKKNEKINIPPVINHNKNVIKKMEDKVPILPKPKPMTVSPQSTSEKMPEEILIQKKQLPPKIETKKPPVKNVKTMTESVIKPITEPIQETITEPIIEIENENEPNKLAGHLKLVKDNNKNVLELEDNVNIEVPMETKTLFPHKEIKPVYSLKKSPQSYYILEKEKPNLQSPHYSIQRIQNNGNIVYKILSKNQEIKNDENEESIPISDIYNENHFEIYKIPHCKLVTINNIPRNQSILYYVHKNNSFIVQTQVYVNEIVEKAIYLHNESILDNISIKILTQRCLNLLEIDIYVCFLGINQHEIKVIQKINAGEFMNSQGKILYQNLNYKTSTGFVFTLLYMKSKSTMINCDEILYEENLLINQKKSTQSKVLNINNLDSNISIQF